MVILQKNRKCINKNPGLLGKHGKLCVNLSSGSECTACARHLPLLHKQGALCRTASDDLGIATCCCHSALSCTCTPQLAKHLVLEPCDFSHLFWQRLVLWVQVNILMWVSVCISFVLPRQGVLWCASSVKWLGTVVSLFIFDCYAHAKITFANYIWAELACPWLKCLVILPGAVKPSIIFVFASLVACRAMVPLPWEVLAVCTLRNSKVLLMRSACPEAGALKVSKDVISC